MNHQGNQQRILRRSTRSSRGAIASSEENHENTTEEFYQDYKCAICLDVITDPYIIPECCHRFCCHCIHASIKAGNKECPTCRARIVSKRNLRRDELFGKLLNRLLQVESQVKEMKLKEKATTSLPLENEETNRKEIEQEKSKNETCDKEKISAKSKKRKLNGDENNRQIPFEHRLADLQKFKDKHNHCNVPNRYKDDPSLGHWVTGIRGSYKQIQLGKKPRYDLTQSKIEKLEEMGFEWTRKLPIKTFDTNLSELKKFKEKYGHCNVPRKHKDDPSLRYKDDLSLAFWVQNIRATYKQIQHGKKPRRGLTPSQIEKLEKIGFQWHAVNQSFDTNISKLKKFKEKYGHCNVPQKSKYDSIALGLWVKNMRATYKEIQLGKKPRQGLTQANIERLDKMGFQWQLRKSQRKA